MVWDWVGAGAALGVDPTRAGAPLGVHPTCGFWEGLEGGVVWLGLAMRQYSGEPGLGQSLKKRVKPPPPFVRPEDIIFCVLPKID